MSEVVEYRPLDAETMITSMEMKVLRNHAEIHFNQSRDKLYIGYPNAGEHNLQSRFADPSGQ